jgi:hypothetical protein
MALQQRQPALRNCGKGTPGQQTDAAGMPFAKAVQTTLARAPAAIPVLEQGWAAHPGEVLQVLVRPLPRPLKVGDGDHPPAARVEEGVASEGDAQRLPRVGREVGGPVHLHGHRGSLEALVCTSPHPSAPPKAAGLLIVQCMYSGAQSVATKEKNISMRQWVASRRVPYRVCHTCNVHRPTAPFTPAIASPVQFVQRLLLALRGPLALGVTQPTMDTPLWNYRPLPTVTKNWTGREERRISVQNKSGGR